MKGNNGDRLNRKGNLHLKALRSTPKCKVVSCSPKYVMTWRTCLQRRFSRKQIYAHGVLMVFALILLFVVCIIPRPDRTPFPDEATQVLLGANEFPPSRSDLSFMKARPQMSTLLELKVHQKAPRSKPKVAVTKAPNVGYINNPLGLSRDLKVFVYELPSAFNEDWLQDKRCASHLFAAEVAIHRRLLESPVRTSEPSEADFFFVPVYLSCNFSTTSGFPSLSHARSLLETAVGHVSAQMPYWNRSSGRDHVFVATHDYGPCFHTMEDLAVASGIPHFLRDSVILQTFGQTDGHACQAHNHIHIPPFVRPYVVQSGWKPEHRRRDIWAYFRGKMEVNPKNVSGRIYSRGVRSTIWHKFRRDRRFFIKRTRAVDYHSELRRSVFCLCPLGWAPWSPRIVESVISGCVPVIIADRIALPYSHFIKWPQISVTVPEKDVGKLGKILEKVSRTNLSAIQGNLWNGEYRQALLYTDPVMEGDATWQILELLSRKLSNASSS